jgi:hypothetical protein
MYHMTGGMNGVISFYIGIWQRQILAFHHCKEVLNVLTVPLQVFIDIQESLCQELNKVAREASINATIMPDNQQFTGYSCYVGRPRA